MGETSNKTESMELLRMEHHGHILGPNILENPSEGGIALIRVWMSHVTPSLAVSLFCPRGRAVAFRRDTRLASGQFGTGSAAASEISLQHDTRNSITRSSSSDAIFVGGCQADGVLAFLGPTPSLRPPGTALCPRPWRWWAACVSLNETRKLR